MPTLDNGTTYPDTYNDEAIRVLENARILNTRIRVTYNHGDGIETIDTGYVQRTCGNRNAPGGGIKAAMLVYNRRSMGGCPLTNRAPVSIRRSAGGEVLYLATVTA